MADELVVADRGVDGKFLQQLQFESFKIAVVLEIHHRHFANIVDHV